SANKMRSARGHSSSPPASTGRMSSPGENHDCDTCTAATLMNAVTTVSSSATRRFPVMSWRDTSPPALRQAERTASSGRATPRATMWADLYPAAGVVGTRAGQRAGPGQAENAPGRARRKRSWRCHCPAGRKASMATPFQIRPVTEDELPAFEVVDQHAFNGRPDNERERANWLARLELDRTLGAFDGTMLVGVTGVYSFQMRVPGAMAAVAGVSMVAVLPSHRRRAVLSALMRRQLADITGRGGGAAGLFAPGGPLSAPSR